MKPPDACEDISLILYLLGSLCFLIGTILAMVSRMHQ